MAEIMSAEDFVTALFIKWAELKYEEIEAEAVARVRSRDKAIVERIRERMEAELLHCDLDETDITLILDDVLRELGGEQ